MAAGLAGSVSSFKKRELFSTSEKLLAVSTEMGKTIHPLKDLCSCQIDVPPEVLESVSWLAVELAREGREGRQIGTIFTVGDSGEVMSQSRSLILDPLMGHKRELKQVVIPEMQETPKELAQLDGAFVISSDGVATSAARYLEAPTRNVSLPFGLGARHMAAAAISQHTRAVAIVLSTSSVVRIFDDGQIIAEIFPWLAGEVSSYIQQAQVHRITNESVTIVCRS
jgi:DNA integrity scanning protein DisA with diadenylate cyclase activity